MTNLLAAEWLKARKRWMPYILTFIMLAIVALLFWGSGTQSGRVDVIMPRAWLSAISFASLISLVLWPILGGSWAGNEYGWGTVRTILSRRPDRIEWTAAALIVLVTITGLALLAAVVLGSIAGIAVASLTSHSIFVTSGLQSGYWLILLKAFVGTWYVLAFYVVVAYAAGTIARSAAVGVGVGIGITFAQLIAYGILDRLGGTWREIAYHLPYAYSNALVTRLTASGASGTVSSSVPSVGISLIGVTVYMVIAIAITLFAVKSRDVTS